ncbi:MAG: pyridoxamine 5'-phosphate oxidase family protein [Actinobacteria bacterium]|nr:pyridoxamine 5'-phosphate oxidase family protein [Actinomycetota bacterium]MCG2808504.1 pyridoxamine 5'-phosphate oxidase family protein [Coriobacteriia bacterium]MDP2232839.1 pyridoxamine 5'-phosphate oxidase family protein [Actinomycetota bacterium]
MKLGQDASKALRTVGGGGAVVYLTTSSRSGNPNTVGERFVTLYKEEFILIAEMFAQKTRVNINENPHGVITLAHPVKGRTWVFSGPITILQEGHEPGATWEGLDVAETLSEWGDWATKEPPSEVPPDIRPPALVQRGVIALRVTSLTDFHPDRAGEPLHIGGPAN